MMEDKTFEEKEIDRLKIVRKAIEKEGLEALHDIDKPKGVEWALNKIDEDIEYFNSRRKEGTDEAQNVAVSGDTKYTQGKEINRERMPVNADTHADTN